MDANTPCADALIALTLDPMKKETAAKHFGSASALARALRISTAAVAQWGEDVPPLRQFQLEYMTGGKLRADEKLRPVV